MTDDLKFPDGNVKAAIVHFDKVAFRSRIAPNKAQLAILRANAVWVGVRIGHPIRGSDRRFLIVLIVPRQPALALADELGWMPNYFEAAVDTIVSEWKQALELHYFLDGSFVHSWHGKQKLVRYSPLGADDPCATTYSGQPKAGRLFAWYSHRPSKITGEPCLHLEARYRGVAACRRAGVYTAADLIHFDHIGHWQRHLACYRIDTEQLGRSNTNKSEGTRRQKPHIHRSGYNVDAAKGSLLFRALSAHENQDLRSVQRFVDRYGRGPFLHRYDVSRLLSLSVNHVRQSLKSRNQLDIVEENVSETAQISVRIGVHVPCPRSCSPSRSCGRPGPDLPPSPRPPIRPRGASP